jgi:DNA (cytosine-5)-methyltransferase 1
LNGLWRHYLRIVGKIQPLAFVVENVPEFLRSKEFKAFERRASRMGFRMASGVLDASGFGVPQKRRRAFIFGMRGVEPVFPEPTGQRSTVRQALRGLPIKPNGRNLHVGRNPKPLSIERYKCIPTGGNRFDLVKKRPDISPKCWLKKRTGSTDVFGRLLWEGLAPTIRTEFFKPEKGRYLHPKAHRAITLREAARLQSFPDRFKFFGSTTQVARQIGNAVPPRLAKAAAKALLQSLPEAERIMRRRRKSRKQPRRSRRLATRSFRKAA